MLAWFSRIISSSNRASFSRSAVSLDEARCCCISACFFLRSNRISADTGACVTGAAGARVAGASSSSSSADARWRLARLACAPNARRQSSSEHSKIPLLMVAAWLKLAANCSTLQYFDGVTALMMRQHSAQHPARPPCSSAQRTLGGDSKNHQLPLHDRRRQHN